MDDNCVFCKLANGVFPSATVYEDEDFRVILDLNPAQKGHALILPKQHYRDLTELPDELAARVLPLAARIGTAMKKTLPCDGFNVLQNNGTAAGQTVFHFHVHVIPRYQGAEDIVTWVPGTMAAQELAETAEALAAALK